MRYAARKKRLAVALASIAVAATVTASPMTAAGAGTAVVDLAITVADAPDPVAPAPGTVVYTIVATNNGATPVLADIEDSTSGGSINTGASTLPAGCSATSTTTVRCDGVQIAPAIPFELHVAVDIDVAVTNTASVSLSPDVLDAIEADTSNNTAEEDTSVGSGTESASYLAEGETLSFKKHSLHVRGSDSGVITRMADADLAGLSCGTGVCADQGLHIDFYENDVYSGHILTTVNFGTAPPCRGIGAAKCNRLFYRTSADDPMREIFECVSGDFRTESGPCIEEIRKIGTEFEWDVRMTSTDPDLGSLKL